MIVTMAMIVTSTPMVIDAETTRVRFFFMRSGGVGALSVVNKVPWNGISHFREELRRYPLPGFVMRLAQCSGQIAQGELRQQP
jgi:hypothetical protein